MIRYSSNLNQYFFIGERDKDRDATDFEIRIYNDPQQVCRKPENLYRTNFSYNVYEISVDDSKNIEHASLSSQLLRNETHNSYTTWETLNGEQIH